MIFIDANIFMYAAGRPSPQREPCRRYLRRLTDPSGAPEACTNAEVLQEILHRYRSLGMAQVGFDLVDAVADLGIPVAAIRERDVMTARRLMEAAPELATRDAIHLAMMRERGIEEALSYDRGLTAPWMRRLEP